MRRLGPVHSIILRCPDLVVLPAHSVVHLARHDHGLELLKVLRIS